MRWDPFDRSAPRPVRRLRSELRACAILGSLAWTLGAQAQPVDVIEYYHAGFDHYFVTSLQADIQALDSGQLAGWARTGASFKAYATPTAGASPVCRFYIPPAQGNSHFYSASPTECVQTAAKFPTFVEESPEVMYIRLPDPVTGACAPGGLPVYRVWSNRADSNHRYTTDAIVRDRMVARGWVAEGYGPDAVIMCAVDLGKSQLLVRAFMPDGSSVNVGQFASIASFRNAGMTDYRNYGVFAIGTMPGTPQIGSDLKAAFVDGVPAIGFDVPAQQPFYFTALWQAPVIGTVYMRADNNGAGIVAQAGQPQTIEVPYHFALSEFAQAQRLMDAGPYSAGLQTLFAQAAAAVDAATATAGPAARAQAAYTALSYAMPLKERIVVENANRAITAAGRRNDFDLNYEGFGTWTNPAYAFGYETAKDAGFKSVYTVVDWKIVSPAPGVYNFDYLDFQIDNARAQGFDVALQAMWGLGSLPEWTWSLSFDELKVLYYENARRVVSRYGDKVAVYYACGEMELNTQWLTLDQAAELARQALAGARSIAPNRKFGIYTSASAYVSYQINLVPSPTYFSGTDLLAYLKWNAIDFDFVALQMQYSTVFAPIDIQRFQEVLQQTYDIVKVPIVMGETGYSSKAEDYGIPAPSYWHGGFTQQAQFDWADGTLRALYALPFVQGYYWVHLDPDNSHLDDPFLSLLVGTGLLRADGAAKKVRNAFKDFNHWVNGLPAAP